MRHSVTLALALGGVVAIVASAGGCPSDARFNCVAATDCAPDEICQVGVCAKPGACAKPELQVQLFTPFVVGNELQPVCEGAVTARDAAGVLHDVPRDPSLPCVFSTTLVGDVTLEARAFNLVKASEELVASSCGVTTVDITLARAEAVCDLDLDCPGAACAIAADGASASCTPSSSTSGAAGAPCGGDDECASARCIGGACSGLCNADADCGPTYMQCAPVDALLAHKACVERADLPDVACADDADCNGTDRVCAAVVDGALQCEVPPGRGLSGTVCTNDAQCADGLCDDDRDGRCTRSCAPSNAGDCAVLSSSGQTTCAPIAEEGLSAFACFQTCTKLAQCDDNVHERTCRGRADFDSDVVVFACDGPFGTADVGDVVPDGDSCATHFALAGNDGQQYCSAPCVDGADCPQNGACLPRDVFRPNGGTFTIDACSY